jgi:RNA polymerase sigma-70 factor (ECF subfamily)
MLPSPSPETEPIDDGRLLEAARSGDREAFAELIDRHKDALVSYLTRIAGRQDEAEDMAQEAFVRLYERSKGYREEGKLRSYLFSIATNLVRSRERQRRRREALRSMFLASPNGHRTPPAQQHGLLGRELQAQLTDAIAALPLRYRTPLVLYEIEGWSYRQICELTGCREGTVKSRIYRGRRWLRERLEPYWKRGQTT